MKGAVGLKPPSKRSKRKVSQSQTEDIGNKKKPAELSVKATVVSCERIQLYLYSTNFSLTKIETYPNSRSLGRFFTTHNY